MGESGTPLLGTKLVIPPLRLPLVPRPRLVERLRETLNYSLVLISASAGFGKTTLLSDWARRHDPRIPIAWLSLDEGDNDPARFWDYVVAALRTLQPSFGESSSAMLHSGQSFPVESLLTVLINELALLSSPFVLVLDDYHLIMAKPIHDGITYLIEHMPAQMHLVMATRVDPPLPLPHFRGRGVMLEIRTDDLRFSRDEAVALFEAVKTTGLSDENVDRLQSHTEGWAVGLKMAALALQRQPDVAGFIVSFTGSQRYIMDYLMEEVLERQSDDVRDFLLKTSVLERLVAPLCDALTDRNDSREVLRWLERANLFIAPMNESREWYRYDHLFMDLLRHQLEVRFGAGHAAELHRRASQWYEGQGFIDEAIDHALDAKDWSAGARLLHQHQSEKLRIGESVTVLNWLRRLPEEVRNRDLQMCVYYGSLLLGQGQLDAAEAVANHLDEVAGDDNRARGTVASLRSRIALAKGDTNRAFELAKEALSFFPPGALDGRAVLSMSLGSHLWMKGQFNDAEPWLTEAYEAGREAGHRYIASLSLSLLASIAHAGGELRRPYERHLQVIDLAGPTAGAASSYQVLGAISYEWNDLETAVHHLERAIELGQRLFGSGMFLARQHCLLAQVRLALGDEAGAVEALERSCRIAHNASQPRFRSEHAVQHINLALLQDDLTTASRWGRKLAEDAAALPFYWSHVSPRLLIAQGEKARAAERLHALYEENINGVVQHPLISVRLYQALAADTTESALSILADVLAMAEPEGYIRMFVDEGKLLAPLLRQAISRGISHDYSARLLAIIEGEDRQRRIRRGEIPASPSTASLLSEREMEVLRLIAAGLSDRQIAAKLIVTLGTAKTHVHRILGKLNAASRTHAVTQARDLKLI